jgi:uncharacterized membrane protein YphA (DoxX/SURF4 family)
MLVLYPNDASLLDSAGRLLIVALFVILGIRNVSAHQIEDHVHRLGLAGAPMARLVFWIGVALEFTGSALLLINWHPAIGALCLIVFTVLASSLLHRFWTVTDPGKRIGMQNGMCANIAVVGGLLLLLQNVR